MRITKITIEGLFGLFNHTIDFKLKERIVLIHGPNGIGKTTILRLIDALFSKNFEYIKGISFKELCIEFNTSAKLVITNNDTYKKPEFKMCYFDDHKHKSLNLYRIISKRINERNIITHSRLDDDFINIPENRYKYIPTEEVFHVREINEILKYENLISEGLPDWYLEIIDNINVISIETQRLISFNRKMHTNRRISNGPLLTVKELAKDISNIVNNIKADYASGSQSLDATFPERLIKRLTEKGEKKDNIITEDLTEKFNSLKSRKLQLINVGLLEKEKKPFKLPNKIEPFTQKVLDLYIADMTDKLDYLDFISQKIYLFTNIINELFLFKKVFFSTNQGFVFRSDNSAHISPTDLSSGEQHQFVLWYELLFRSKQNSLILIDEPELSLHLEWQEVFLNNLIKISELSNLYSLIATHAPQIVNNRWDLTVDLYEKGE